MYIQIPTTAGYYKYSFFPLVIVQRNYLPAQVIMSLDLKLYAAFITRCHRPWNIVFIDNGYPHDGRADKDPYPHDRRADKDSYPHDSNNQCIILRLQLSFAMILLT